jgi:hypothetical protein
VGPTPALLQVLVCAPNCRDRLECAPSKKAALCNLPNIELAAIVPKLALRVWDNLGVNPIRCSLACCVVFLALAVSGTAQQTFRCPETGEIRIAMDPRQVAIRYEGTSLAGAIGKVGLFSSNLSFGTTQLQQATDATQQWNQLILALVIGWNSCAISKDEYSEGLQRIYPVLKADAEEFDQIAGLLSRGHKIDESRLQTLLASYISEIRRLAEIAGSSPGLARMSEILVETKTNTDKILVEIKRYERLVSFTEGRYPLPAMP